MEFTLPVEIDKMIFPLIARFNIFILLLLSIQLSATQAERTNLKLIHQFPNGTWVENIAVRPNGNLLVTLVDTPELWEINPFKSSSPHTTSPARLIHHFTNATMANGITELSPDVFAIIASNTIYNADFTNSHSLSTKNLPTISTITNIPTAGVLNGMTTLNHTTGIVLISDSRLGLIWRLDTTTGSYSVVMQDSTMTALPGRRSLIGINGIKTLNDYVYYNNCPGEMFCRVRIDTETATAIGPYEILARNVLADDFAITSDGTAYLAGLDDNVVTRVWSNGTVEDVAGNLNSSGLAGATAAAFGRTKWDGNVLYVTTGGGEAAPVNGTYVEGGKVMALILD